MEIQEVEVIIRPDGATELRVRGAKGPACLALTQELEALLGGAPVSRTTTAEFHEQTSQQDSAPSKISAGW